VSDDRDTARRRADEQALDEIFAGFRAEAADDTLDGAAEAALTRGLALHAAGQVDECVLDLEWAARSPRLRFRAASCLGRIHRSRGRLPEAVDWFERAAESPAPTDEESRRLLYELGGALEMAGEPKRALAVYLELKVAAGDYLDVASRVARLAEAGDQE
jgi:tetratricopeptide (TPR) repeat protein